ncbi:MAG: M24 family metallopeptidase [Nitrososphaeria archaeon]
MFPNLAERRKNLLSKAERMCLRYVLVSSPENIYYLTNFWGGSYVLLSEDQCILFTGMLESFRALNGSIDTKVVSAPVGKSLLSIISNYVPKNSKILAEDNLSTQKSNFEEKLKVKLNISSKPFHELRRRKDDYEVKAISEAAKRIDQLFDITVKTVKEGISEREIASKVVGFGVEIGLDMPMTSSGFEPVIIASGPNSAYPHAQLTSRKVRRGDIVKGDYFFRYKAYIADETRTFVLGQPSKEAKEAYEIVLNAQEECVKELKVGAVTSDLDNICRKIIGSSRFSERFIHGTGHGVGLEVHEPPTLSVNQKDRLIEGDVITVEPGVYIPKKFGIRIEDTVHIGKKSKVLTKFTKELIEI